MKIKIEVLQNEFSVVKVGAFPPLASLGEFFFIGKTDNENSLVCETNCLPSHVSAREDGWKCLRITGELDFSLVGIIAKISGLLAEAGISLFVVSTFDTDYILIKENKIDETLAILSKNGYSIANR